MKIGAVTLQNNLIAAPMAGVTDLAFRRLCRRLGAGLTVSEMVAANPSLADTRTSRLRRTHDAENTPRVVQIAGGDVKHLVSAARRDVDEGAQIIDINMGCPAKKVCRLAAGSALLSNERLVAQILDAVVSAVSVPVTLKIRTGPTPQTRNAVRVAQMAERAGIAAISVHGRSRACGFKGSVDYDAIRHVKRAVTIPVVANGDITSPRLAREVLNKTGADALMIGRAAQGNPWIFREVAHFLHHGELRAPPSVGEVMDVLLEHLDALYQLYGDRQGVRVARKHLGWYLRSRWQGEVFWRRINQVECAREQTRLTTQHLSRLAEIGSAMERAA